MYLTIAPIDQKCIHGQIYRGPSYLRWRFAPRLDLRWSLMDFGHTSPIAVVAVEGKLRAPDVMPLPVTWSQTDRDRVGGYLRSAGIETDWINGARDWREAWQRIAGMAQVYQSFVDDGFTSAARLNPTAWLGRDIHFGMGILHALDREMQWREQEASLPRIGEWILRGRSWVSEITGRHVPLIAGGALPVSDPFTTGTDQALTSYSASYTNNSNTFAVAAATDDVYQNSDTSNGGEGAVHWNADTFANDQYASVKLNAVIAGIFRGPAVRAHASAATYYGFYADNADHYLFKNVTGTWTQIGTTDTTNGAVNDILRLEISGTTLTPKRNGTTWTQGTRTDSSITSGYGGMCGYGNSSSARIDDFESGNLGGASASLLLDRGRQHQDLLVR